MIFLCWCNVLRWIWWIYTQSNITSINLVKDAINLDVSDNWKRKKSEHTNTHLTELKDTIRSCGISFDIWEEENADGKGSGQYDFTSLMGADKKKLLKELPSKFNGIIRPETCNTVEEIWLKFYIIYAMITWCWNDDWLPW